MAKIGKPEKSFDPFQKGNEAFGALDEVLGELDAPEQSEPAPSTPAPSRKKRGAPAQPKDKPARKPQARKAKQPASDGGGKEDVALELERTLTPRKSVQPKKAKRFLATPEEGMRFEQAAMRLSAELGVTLDFSKVTRALWEIYLRHEDDILRNVPSDEVWIRPSNNDALGMAELDDRLARLLNDGLMVASRRPRNTRPTEE